MTRLAVLALGLALLLGARPAAGEGQAPAVDMVVYLPLFSRNTTLSGTVTLYGVPVAGVPVELRYFDGATWLSRGFATTDSAGQYFFSPPSLNASERYYVRYMNSTDPSRLGYWATKELASYSASVGGSVAAFDIADIVLSAPANDAELSLPIGFSWFVRPATPNDSYVLNLYDPIDDIVYYTNPLGYVNAYTAYGTPYVDQWYAWWVGVYANNAEVAVTDAYGEAYDYHWVYVLPGALNSAPASVWQQRPLADTLPARIDPQTDRPVRQPVRVGP
jgi:hypothetical protein